MHISSSNYSLSRATILAIFAVVSVSLNAEYGALSIFRGLDQSELNESEWVLTGRAELEPEVAAILDFSSAIYENLPDRSDYFIVQGDSLLWTGYSVGRNLGLISDKPMLFAKGMDHNNYSTPEYYLCNGKLDVTTRVKEVGEIEWKEVSIGSAIVSPGDTIHNVLLTRQAFTNRTLMGDTAKVTLPDVSTYRWYVSGMSAPLAIQRNGKLFFNDELGQFAISDSTPKATEYDEMKRVIDGASIVSGSGYINVSLPDEINLTAFLMDESGNIYGVTSGVARDFEINVSGLQPGRYILSLVAEPEALYVRKELIIL